MSHYAPGGRGGAPPRPQDDCAPPDLDPSVVDAIQNLVNARLDANRSFNNPAVLDEIRNLIRNFDPADDIVGRVETLCSEAETETEIPTIMQGIRLDHAPSFLDPATRFVPAVRDEMLPSGFDILRRDPAVRDEMVLPSGFDILRRDPAVRDEMLPSAFDILRRDPAVRDEMLPSAFDILRRDPAVRDEMLPFSFDIQDDRAPLDLDPAIVAKILNVVNAHLDANRNFNNPAVLDEIPKLLRIFDQADDIVCIVEQLCLEAETETEQYEQRGGGGGQNESDDGGGGDVEKAGEQEPASTNGPSSSTETQSPVIVQGSRLDHAPSDLDPAILDKIRRLGPGVLDEMLKLGPLILDQIRNQKGGSLPPGECWSYLRTGTCKNGSSCKYKHPPRSKDKQNDFRSEGRNAKVRTSNNSRGQPSVAPAGENFLGLPIRPGEKGCPYYMQHGACKYELNCKYNHPDPKPARKSDPVSTYGNGGPATFQGASPSTVEPSSPPRSLNDTPRYVPPMVIPPSQNAELNSYQDPANLPERSMLVLQPQGIDNSVTETITHQQHPPEKRFLLVCDSFSKTGYCHESFKCKYHHPPKSVTETTTYQQHPPEKRFLLVCDSFSKTGYCHKSSKCKYHHPPKYQTSVSPSCQLSDEGLPLRPGQNICTQYRSFGICNSGPSCEFDHPSSPTSTL